MAHKSATLSNNSPSKQSLSSRNSDKGTFVELSITDHTRLKDLTLITRELKRTPIPLKDPLRAASTKQAVLELQFVTDAVMSWLNREFRKKTGPTDVLTFPTYIWRTKVQPNKLLLGSIIIAPAFAERKWFGRRAVDTPERSRLFVKLFRHGLAHIYGRHHK